ncbi:MAG: efflux RND transporter permease subunit [Acidobacteria bacterium]|nr:efflux RND transporter permease subunit [Acidobacteriota bacterium]
MNGTIAWFGNNPVAANLVMVFIIVSGLVASTSIRAEIFAEIALDRISIQVPYLGAAPEEVESGVVIRIEEAIQGIDGIKRIHATASEGLASVTVELDFSADARRVLDEIKNSIDAITTFPLETEEPIISEVIARTQVVDVAISGNADLSTLKTLAERVRAELSALPEITQVDLVGAPPYEISIEVSEAALRRHGMTFDRIAEAVRRESLDLPGGSVRTDGGEIQLRTTGQAYRGAEYEDLVLWTRPDGSRLRVGDVATVVDGFAETNQQARFDRQPTVLLSISRAGDRSVLDIATAVTRYVERTRAGLPRGVTMTVWRNQADVLRERLSVMLRSGAAGFLLVCAVLAVFLHLRLAWWVSLGIPIPFLGAIALMPGLDVSVNITSLFAFILVLGILVDDAIIVGENVHRHHEQAGAGVAGAVAGAQQIAKPVVFAVLTTVAAFLPLLIVPGFIGKAFRAVPLIVIPCLLFSLVESLAILPAHLAHVSKRRARGRWGRLQEGVREGLRRFVETGYQPALRIALRWRYLTVALALATLIVTGGMVLGGWTGFRFLGALDIGYMTATVTMPQGVPLAATVSALQRLEDGAARLRARLAQDTGLDYFRHVSTTVGDQPVQSRAGDLFGVTDVASAANIGEVIIELAGAEARSYDSGQLGNLWREETGPIPEAVEVAFDTSPLNPGSDVDVQLSGPDLNQLRDAAAAVRRRLAAYAGVYAISDSFRAGKPERRLDITPAAQTLGLTLQDLGRQVRQAFYGEEAQRIQRGRDDVRVMVRYPRDERRSLGDLENMRIRTPSGGEVPFSVVAQVESGFGFASITRVDRNRSVNVTAAVDPATASAGSVISDLRERVLPEVLAEYPGVFFSFQGVQAEQAETLASLRRGFLLAMLLIYMLLAIPLRSYLQPLIIMAAVPFGVVGAIWGHLLMGLDLSILSVFGLVALTGVVVNDSLVMVDFINGARRDAPEETEANGLQRALLEAGAVRFRPILLTSLTTFVGLAPLMLERSTAAMTLVPMAVSLAFGVLFATFITLILVPAIYLILADSQYVLQRAFGR